MLKSTFKVLGSFFLVLSLILGALIVWTIMSPTPDTTSVDNYLAESLPAVGSWDVERALPYLSNNTRKTIDSDKGRKSFAEHLKKFGTLQHFDNPELIGRTSGATIQNGSYQKFKYSVVGHFERADITMEVVILDNDGSLSFDDIYITSALYH